MFILKIQHFSRMYTRIIVEICGIMKSIVAINLVDKNSLTDNKNKKLLAEKI